MNPTKRSLIQLTVSGIERDMEMMRILHGPDASLRRDLLQSYKLDKDDIDS
jgi:DNA gyrase/topoisomerase IV subunit B